MDLDYEATAGEVVDENPDAADDYRKGDAGALNFLVGQFMESSGGRADPATARKYLEMELGGD